MKDFNGKRVLITGPARGIGAEMARQLARAGAKLSLIGLEADRLQTLVSELGEGHHWAECDVCDVNALKVAVQSAVDKLGGLDVVVANAGISSMGTFANTPLEVSRKVIDVNLLGVMNVVHLSLPALIESEGFVFCIGSSAGLIALPGMAAYSASKIGLYFFANSLRLELAHVGVGVGVGIPSWVDTDLVTDQLRDSRSLGELLEYLPWPFGQVTSVEKCASRFLGAICKRKRRTFVPFYITPYAYISGIYRSPVWEFFVGLYSGTSLPKLDKEVQESGRFFGVSSRGNELVREKATKS